MRNKILFALSALPIIALILAIAFYFSIPHFLNSETTKEKLNAYFLKNTGGNIEFKKSEFSLFPLPRITFRQLSLTVPNKAKGRIEALSVQPSIFSLIKGDLRLSKLSLQSPYITVDISEEREKISLKVVEEKIRSVVRHLTSTTPGLLITIQDGKLDLVKDGSDAFSLGMIQSRLIPSEESLSIALTCASNLWENLSFYSSLRAGDLKGEGSVKLKKLRPHKLLAHLSADTGGHIGDSEADLAVKFGILGLSNIRADIEGSVPRLVLLRGERRMEVDASKIRGKIETEPERFSVILKEVHLSRPVLNISGKYSMDRASGMGKVALEARSVDLASTRRIALGFGGDIPLIRNIFDIVRGGSIPVLNFNTQGKSLNDLRRIDNLRISGRIQGGAVYIRKKDLKFNNVAGDAFISKGILEGRNIEASLGNHRGSRGRLTVGLMGKNAPFHVDMWVKADVGGLPSLLKQKNLVTNEAVLREIDRLSDTRGSARGRLILGDRLGSIHVTVDLAQMNIVARYERLPAPLQIRGGQIFFDERSLKMSNMAGSMGNSSFSQLTARISLDNAPGLDISGGQLSVNADEIYPWITAFESTKPVLKDVPSISGTIAVSSLKLKGPIYQVKNWRFTAVGEAKKFGLDSTFFPGKIREISGIFKITEDELSLKDVRLSMIDSVLTVSGNLREFPRNIGSIDLSLRGRVGPGVAPWIARLVDLPRELEMHAPFSLETASITWKKNLRTTFDGRLMFGRETQLSLRLTRSPDRLLVHELSFKDGNSDASANIMLKKDKIDIAFKGIVNSRTFDAVLAQNIFYNSSLQGDFKAHILLKDPRQSTVVGKLDGKNLPVPWGHNEAFIVESIAVEAQKKRIRINSAHFKLGKSKFTANGTLDTLPKWFSVDMDLSSDGIDWDTVERLVQASEKTDNGKDEGFLKNLPVRGTLRIRSGFFKFAQFNWKPFNADVSFDGETMHVVTKKAALCGISTTGDVRITDRLAELDIRLSGKNLEFRPTVLCLSNKRADVTGTFNMEANLKGRGKIENISNKIDGSFTISAKDGKIYKSRSLNKTLDTLNETENFKGKFPDLNKQSIAYRDFTASGAIKKNIIKVEESMLDARVFGIIARGEIDIESETLDLNALVSPVSIAQRIMGKIPILGKILGGNLVSVPVKIKGNINDPQVTFLSPSAIGSELLGIVKRTIKLPVTLIEPVLPGKK